MRRLLLIGLALLTSCGKEEKPVEPKLPKVKVAEAEAKDVPYTIATIGQVHAFNTVDIIPQIQGQLTGAFVDQGTYVEAGDLLFTIDPRIYEAELVQNRGLLEQAEASLRFNEERVLRFGQLLPEEFVSKLDYEMYVSQAQEAAGQVEQYRAAVEESEVNLQFAYIVAPMAGRLGLRFIDPGNIVSPEEKQPIITLNQIEPININFRIPERYVPLVQKYQTEEGLKVEATVRGEEGKSFNGRVTFIDNQVNLSSGTILLKGEYANTNRLLWPGQFCDVALKLYEIPNAVVIPAEALGVNMTGPYTYVVKEDNTVELRQLKLGQLLDDGQVVESGVQAGERVVTDGQMMLRPGVKVSVE